MTLMTFIQMFAILSETMFERTGSIKLVNTSSSKTGSRSLNAINGVSLYR